MSFTHIFKCIYIADNSCRFSHISCLQLTCYIYLQESSYLVPAGARPTVGTQFINTRDQINREVSSNTNVETKTEVREDRTSVMGSKSKLETICTLEMLMSGDEKKPSLRESRDTDISKRNPVAIAGKTQLSFQIEPEMKNIDQGCDIFPDEIYYSDEDSSEEASSRDSMNMTYSTLLLSKDVTQQDNKVSVPTSNIPEFQTSTATTSNASTFRDLIANENSLVFKFSAADVSISGINQFPVFPSYLQFGLPQFLSPNPLTQNFMANCSMMPGASKMFQSPNGSELPQQLVMSHQHITDELSSLSTNVPCYSFNHLSEVTKILADNHEMSLEIIHLLLQINPQLANNTVALQIAAYKELLLLKKLQHEKSSQESLQHLQHNQQQILNERSPTSSSSYDYYTHQINGLNSLVSIRPLPLEMKQNEAHTEGGASINSARKIGAVQAANALKVFGIVKADVSTSQPSGDRLSVARSQNLQTSIAAGSQFGDGKTFSGGLNSQLPMYPDYQFSDGNDISKKSTSLTSLGANYNQHKQESDLFPTQPHHSFAPSENNTSRFCPQTYRAIRPIIPRFTCSQPHTSGAETIRKNDHENSNMPGQPTKRPFNGMHYI